MTSRRTKISPKTGRGLSHVTHTILGSTVGYPSDSLASCYFRSTSVFSALEVFYENALYKFTFDIDYCNTLALLAVSVLFITHTKRKPSLFEILILF